MGKETALILAGAVAKGAFEAGALHTLAEHAAELNNINGSALAPAADALLGLQHHRLAVGAHAAILQHRERVDIVVDLVPVEVVVVTVVAGVVLLGERLRPHQWAGVGIALAGIAVVAAAT